MKKSKRFLSLLLAVVMAMSLLLMTGMADNSAADDAANAASTYVKNDDTWDSGVNGLKMHKEYVSTNNGTSGTLKLEAYVTGESQTTMVTQPVDTALVLDASGSMSDDITIGSGVDVLPLLDTKYGGAEGTYTIKIKVGLVQLTYPLRYNNGAWQYDKKFGTWTDIIGSGWEDDVKNTYITKQNALKIAAKHYIDSAVASSDPNHPNRIAIVSYADDATTVMKLTDVTTGAQDLKNAIDKLGADGGTHSNLGLKDAQAILAESTQKKVAIMFTDGEPGLYGDWETESEDTANDAIGTSKDMKAAGVTVYTVGCFSELKQPTKTETYMNYVSSNYPNATDMDHGGTGGADKGYYLPAPTSSELSKVFDKIAQETGGASYTLNSAAVMQDVVSQYFDIDTSNGKTVKAHTETCTAIDANGNPTKWKNNNDSLACQANGKTVTVTGFDYTANWVGSHSGKADGKKLVLEIPIKDNGTGTNWQKTNAADSAIFSGGKKVADFHSPEVYFPYYEVTLVNANGVGADKSYRLEDETPLTDRVDSGYLYGGAFNDAACTTVYPFVTGVNGKTFVPTDKAHYYVWEAPNKYLLPNDYDVWQHTGKDADREEVHVTHMYMLAPVDRLYYQSVGFLVERDGVTTVTPSQSNGADIAYGVVNATQNGNFYDQVYVKNGVLQSSKAGPVAEANRDAGYISMRELEDANFFNNPGATVTFLPYWVTLDGVMVTGTMQSSCTNLGIGKTDSYKWLDCNEDSAKLTADANVTYAPAMKMLSFCKAAAFETDPAVLEAQTVTITVNDNGSVTTVNLDKGDLTGKLTPAGADGKVFAGWYTDEACTVPADFSDVQSDMTVYAKYVSGAYLSVKYKQVGVFRVRSVTLLSAVDSKDYQDSGYIINGEQVSCTNYKNRYGIITARMIFGRDVSRSAQLMTYRYATTGLTKGDTIEIVPYWVTLDGTLVTGTARTLTYNVRGLNG